MKKRFLSLLLCALMVVGLLPTTAFAAATDYNFDVTVGGVTVSVTSDNCGDVFGDGKIAFEKDGYQNIFRLDSVHIDEISYRRSGAAVSAAVSFEINGIVMIDTLTKIETSTVSGTGTLLLSDKCALADLIHYDRPDGDSFDNNAVIYTRGNTRVYAERGIGGTIWAVSPLSSTSKVFIYHLDSNTYVSRDFEQLSGNGISLYGRNAGDREFVDCFFSHYGMGHLGEDAAQVIRRDTREAPTIEAYAAEKPAVEFPIWIAGEQVTSENKNDVLGDRKVSYIPAASESAMATLVLNDAAIANGADKDRSEYEMISEYLSYAGIIADQDLEIVVTGSCSIINAAETATRIPEYPFGESFGSDFHDECVSRGIDMRGHKLIIEGDGSLTVSGNEYAIVDADSLHFFGPGKTTLNGKAVFKGSSFGLGVFGGRLIMKKTGSGAIFEGNDASNLDMNEDFILYGGANEYTTDLLKYDLYNGSYYIMTQDGNRNINFACIADRIIDTRNTISAGALTLNGASVGPENVIISDNTFADISITSEDAGFSVLPTSWEENGLPMSDVYGDPAWQARPLKANSEYTAYITLKAKEGYRFSDSTSITLDGKKLSVVSITNNYSEMLCKTSTFSTVCKHTFSERMYDDAFHWHKCTFCGTVFDKYTHEWDTGVRFGDAIHYTCTVCGYDCYRPLPAFFGEVWGVPEYANAGDVLTASSTSEADQALLHYQWEISDDGQDWSAISGQTTASFVLDAADEEKYVRVIITADGYKGQQVSRACYITPKLRGTMTITGTPKYGNTLTAAISGSQDADFVYFWYRNGNSIYTSASNQYTPVTEDIGCTISCTVMAYGDITGTLNAVGVVIGKADGPTAPDVTPHPATLEDDSNGWIEISGGYPIEYSQTADFASCETVTSGNIYGLLSGTYYVRTATNSWRSLGEAVTVTVGAHTDALAIKPIDPIPFGIAGRWTETITVEAVNGTEPYTWEIISQPYFVDAFSKEGFTQTTSIYYSHPGKTANFMVQFPDSRGSNLGRMRVRVTDGSGDPAELVITFEGYQAMNAPEEPFSFTLNRNAYRQDFSTKTYTYGYDPISMEEAMIVTMQNVSGDPIRLSDLTLDMGIGETNFDVWFDPAFTANELKRYEEVDIYIVPKTGLDASTGWVFGYPVTLTVSHPESSTHVSLESAYYFKVLPKALDTCTVKKILPQSYTGSAITPRLRIWDGKRFLTEDDYSVEWSNNVELGTAGYTIIARAASYYDTGTGNYSGTVSGSFTIEPPTVTITGVYNGNSLDYVVERLEGNALLIAAEYKDGKFVECRIIPVSKAGTLIGSTGIQVTADADYKMYLVNRATYIPICRSWSSQD